MSTLHTHRIPPQDVIDFWFGELDEHGLADEAHAARWWQKDDAFDELIRARFGAVHADLTAGVENAWLDTPTGRLATVLVLDQFSRNLFRGTAAMFEHDERARAIALAMIEAGEDRAFPVHPRTFLYLPLMHAEDLALQDRCVAEFEALVAELGGHARSAVENNVGFAERHREIIARFGRFPHRNELLGRETTAAEAAFLKEPGSSF